MNGQLAQRRGERGLEIKTCGMNFKWGLVRGENAALGIAVVRVHFQPFSKIKACS